MPNNRFVLNDESRYNSYGFRVANAGIGLSRFKNNPVMLDGHIASNRSVIGKWNDISINGTELSASAEFDTADDNAKSIAGKVERGFVKGASMGLLFNGNDFQLELNGKWLLANCELIEVSIVPVPANAGALRLYTSKNGELHLMGEDEIKLCLGAAGNATDFTKNNNQNMKKVLLSIAALVALGLDKHNAGEGIDVALIEGGIADLKTKLDAARLELSTTKTALKTLQDNALAAKKLAAEKIVGDAIAAGKIDAAAKEEWLKLALENETLATTTLNALPANKSLAAQVNNKAVDAGQIKTADDFEKLPLDAQLAFKTNNPETYKKLFV